MAGAVVILVGRRAQASAEVAAANKADRLGRIIHIPENPIWVALMLMVAVPLFLGSKVWARISLPLPQIAFGMAAAVEDIAILPGILFMAAAAADRLIQQIPQVHPNLAETAAQDPMRAAQQPEQPRAEPVVGLARRLGGIPALALLAELSSLSLTGHNNANVGSHR